MIVVLKIVDVYKFSVWDKADDISDKDKDIKVIRCG